MFGFVGYCVQAKGITWPTKMTFEGASWPTADNNPAMQWDALPEVSKWQIILAVGFLELWGESGMSPHYMRGGKPGAFPSFKDPPAAKSNPDFKLPHPVPFDLYDPFGLFKKMSEEQKWRRLLMEVNNGRLDTASSALRVQGARLGAGAQGPHQPYAGDYMAPRGADYPLLVLGSSIGQQPRPAECALGVWWGRRRHPLVARSIAAVRGRWYGPCARLRGPYNPEPSASARSSVAIGRSR